MITSPGGMPPLSRRWSAIGTWCEIVVSVPGRDTETALTARPVERIADDAQRRAAVLVVELDLACSRFRADSELSRLRHGTAVPISPMLDGAVRAALWTARATDGLVDPTVSAALVASGYDDDLDAVRARLEHSEPDGGPSAGAVETHAVPGYWRVFHDSDARRILVPHRVQLDLGASAKAWLADTTAHLLLSEGIVPAGAGVLVNLGGDIALAGTAPQGGWRVSVDDATTAAEDRPVVTIRGGGLATSSTRLRTWGRGNRRRHHIIDPRTGETAPSTWQAVTVAALTCGLANAASTAAIVLGDDAPRWLAGKGVHARLRHVDGSLVRVGDWPGEPGADVAA